MGDEYHSCFQTQKLALPTEAKDKCFFLCRSLCRERGSGLDSQVRTGNGEGQGFLVPERAPLPLRMLRERRPWGRAWSEVEPTEDRKLRRGVLAQSGSGSLSLKRTVAVSGLYPRTLSAFFQGRGWQECACLCMSVRTCWLCVCTRVCLGAGETLLPRLHR